MKMSPLDGEGGLSGYITEILTVGDHSGQRALESATLHMYA
jgi:hypothetical protein